MNTLYAIALTLSDEVTEGISGLKERYNQYVNYNVEPHLTLVYPFTPEVDITIISEKLEAVAKRTKPFILVLNGIEYFEGVNNVAYAAVESKLPVIDLHTDIIKSLKGLIKESYTDGEFNLENFIPHITICAQIPDEVFPIVKKQFSDYKLHHEIEIGSFSLFSSGDSGIWRPVRVFELSE